jgi:hypothetical protein
VDPEQNRLANEAHLRDLCDRIIALTPQERAGVVTFHVANGQEREYIAGYMREKAPEIELVFESIN